MTCSKRLTAAAPAVLAAAILWAGPAAAQTVCGARAQIVAELERKYGETRRSVGLQEGRGVVEVYASDATGSWTILVTDTAGRACVVAAGDAFEAEVVKADAPA